MKSCKICEGTLGLLGSLGRTKYYRCSACGAQFSQTPRAPRVRKVDIFLRPFQTTTWVYECSTNSAQTLKQVAASFCAMRGLDSTQVKAGIGKKY